MVITSMRQQPDQELHSAAMVGRRWHVQAARDRVSDLGGGRVNLGTIHPSTHARRLAHHGSGRRDAAVVPNRVTGSTKRVELGEGIGAVCRSERRCGRSY